MTDRSTMKLGDVVDRIRDASAQEKVSVADIVDAMGKRSLHPLLLVPALLAATPLSGIPGLSAFCGLLIAVISFEMLMSFERIRLPRVLLRRRVDGAALRRALDKSRPVISWIDGHTRRRFSGLFRRPLIYVPEILCLLSGIAMPALEFIPFSASIVALGVAFLALSMLTRDGVFFILSLVPYAGIVALVVVNPW